jgi:hypothetical protein
MKIKPKSITSILAILLIIAGFLTAFFYIVSLSRAGLIHIASTFNLESASKAGDFIGGIVGSMWSLAGVLLLIQTLQIQQEEIESLKKDSAYDAFKSDFLALIGIFQQQKDNFMFGGHKGVGGFADARVQMGGEITKAHQMLNIPGYDLDEQLLTAVFRRNFPGYSIIYPDLLLEIFSTINEYPILETRNKYYRIFASTMGVDEKIYIYNSIMLLKKHNHLELPEGFYYTFETMPDQHKIFKLTDFGIQADLNASI